MITDRSIIISPHSDDAILSVGGRILVNPEQEQFSVLNSFSTCAFTIIPGLTDVENKITNKTPNYLNCSAKLCEINKKCKVKFIRIINIF